MDFEEDIDSRKGRRVPVGVGINSLLHSFDEGDEGTKKAFRTAKVQNMFKECIKHIYKDSAFLILQNVNAVYILNERDKGMLKKAMPDSKKIKRLVIYTSDSMVYSDLDARQEYIKLWFNDQNERLDKLELYFSKFQMRKRFPYKNDVEFLKNQLSSQQISEAKLVPPTDTHDIDKQISEINNPKLQDALNNLIHP